jgi:hypothetical protein
MTHLAQALGYVSSKNFISADQAGAFGSGPFAHVCRKYQSTRELSGIYTLRQDSPNIQTPVVALFEVSSEERAREIHRLVWNQDFVPFILVKSPKAIRVYSGFEYSSGRNGESELIKPLRDFNYISDVLEGFHADEIDNGTLWSKWGKFVDPSKRVDWHLLRNLEKLARKLRDQGLPKEISHALIGRYVYLSYLKDRGFLSARKLARWGLTLDEVFSRHATLKAFRHLNEKLNDETDGLNGSIFPFSLRKISKENLQTLASTFRGDDPSSGQVVFDFAAYDFSYIPIETLSVIYEQFLHEPQEGEAVSRGRAQGAYYTPIPLVNFVVGEMDQRQALQSGMKILDPSCGSGAFLVQSYRLLIERKIREHAENKILPSELRSILTSQIYGIDRDADACRIAEMSLLVTLLDYVDPPDLEGKYKAFHLPKLSGKNIIEADFFDPNGQRESAHYNLTSPDRFDWIIGNPPWNEIKNPPKDPRDKSALDWMQAKDTPPTGGNQVAEAFIWKSKELMKEGGIAGMVLPAMTLFKTESTKFRKELFSQSNVWRVVNFSNLSYVLFSGRATIPAMSLFFQTSAGGTSEQEPVQASAPFVLNQEANRPLKAGHQLDTWNLTFNSSEVQEIPKEEAIRGDASTWKFAMWGSSRDRKFIERISRKFDTLKDFSEQNELTISEGIQLRSGESPTEDVEHHPELEGALELNFGNLKNCGKILNFPEHAISPVPASRCWVRQGRAKLPMAVSRPPHLILDASRRFAIFSEEFILVPPRQIGIASTNLEDSALLKALALYLNSGFTLYHQFFETSQWGIQKSISTLRTLKKLPVPDLRKYAKNWSAFYSDLQSRTKPGEAIPEKDQRAINRMVSKALGLKPSEQFMIEDFVSVNLLMVHGKVEHEAVRPPKEKEIFDYLKALHGRRIFTCQSSTDCDS